MYNVGRSDPPAGAAIASYDFDFEIGGNPQRVSGDDSKASRRGKVIVDTIQYGATGGRLVRRRLENDPVRVSYLATEWRQTVAEDETVLSNGRTRRRSKSTPPTRCRRGES
jgi:hypothetical protein